MSDDRTEDRAGRAYQPVTPDIAEQLRHIVGKSHVLYEEPMAMQDYARNEVAGEEHTHMPEAVVKPASAAEISEVMKLANQERLPITPRGAGSGLSGGAVPVYGGIILSVERMNRILEIDRQNMVALASQAWSSQER